MRGEEQGVLLYESSLKFNDNQSPSFVTWQENHC